MPVLLDTNVLSELARPKPETRVIAFCRQEAAAFLSVVTLHELVFGAERVKEAGKHKRLLHWIESIERRYGKCVLPVTAPIARHAARMRAGEARAGRVLHIEDAMIAATAMTHSLSLATRNLRDFESLGLRLVNPWQDPHPGL